MKADNVPSMFREMYVRSVDGKSNPHEAIRVHCLMCVGWQMREVDVCTAPTCPLFKYRNRKEQQLSRKSRSTLQENPDAEP